MTPHLRNQLDVQSMKNVPFEEKENWNETKYRIDSVWEVSLCSRRWNDRKYHLYNGLATGPSIKFWCESAYHIQKALGKRSYAQQVLHSSLSVWKVLLWKGDLSILTYFLVSAWRSIRNKISKNSWLLNEMHICISGYFWIRLYEWISFFLWCFPVFPYIL